MDRTTQILSRTGSLMLVGQQPRAPLHQLVSAQILVAILSKTNLGREFIGDGSREGARVSASNQCR